MGGAVVLFGALCSVWGAQAAPPWEEGEVVESTAKELQSGLCAVREAEHDE